MNSLPKFVSSVFQDYTIFFVCTEHCCTASHLGLNLNQETAVVAGFLGFVRSSKQMSESWLQIGRYPPIQSCNLCNL